MLTPEDEEHANEKQKEAHAFASSQVECMKQTYNSCGLEDVVYMLLRGRHHIAGMSLNQSWCV